MNAIYRISLSFLMAVGTVCAASATASLPGMPEIHQRFVSVVKEKSTLTGGTSRFFEVDHTSIHCFDDASAVTILECHYDDHVDACFKLFAVAAERKTFYFQKEKGSALYKQLYFKVARSDERHNDMPHKAIDSLNLYPHKCQLSSYCGELNEALRFIETQ